MTCRCPALLQLSTSVLLALFAHHLAQGQDGPFSQRKQERAEPVVDLVSFALDVTPSPSGGDFFNAYRLLGPTRTGLPAIISPRLALRLTLSRTTRLVFSVSYGGVEFTDIYSVIDSSAPPGTEGYGAFVEKFDSHFYPIMIGLEYSPVRTQFTTYVGGLVGIAPVDVNWNTLTQRESPGELSRPGLNTSGVELEPAGRLYAGIDYQFDEAIRERGMVRGIFIEGSYLVLPVRRDYFTSVRRQGRGIAALPAADDGTLHMGGATLTLGFSLQFSRR